MLSPAEAPTFLLDLLRGTGETDRGETDKTASGKHGDGESGSDDTCSGEDALADTVGAGFAGGDLVRQLGGFFGLPLFLFCPMGTLLT